MIHLPSVVTISYGHRQSPTTVLLFSFFYCFCLLFFLYRRRFVVRLIKCKFKILASSPVSEFAFCFSDRTERRRRYAEKRWVMYTNQVRFDCLFVVGDVFSYFVFTTFTYPLLSCIVFVVFVNGTRRYQCRCRWRRRSTFLVLDCPEWIIIFFIFRFVLSYFITINFTN